MCYMMNSGAMGKLGHGTDADAGTPTLVTALANQVCTMVAAGAGNSGAVTSEGHAYIWGSGVSGQIGDDEHHPRFAPTLVTALMDRKLKQIAFGVKHVAALTDDGQLFSWGDNGFFQLGLGYKRGDDDDEPPPQYSTPQAVTTLIGKRLSSVSCGDNVTMVITDRGELIAWGQGETRQLCTGHDDDVATPTRIQFPFSEEKDTKCMFISLSYHIIISTSYH
jgi:alpha-tubulin suppressor-like RCC1 family protein